jgi:PmbA protein
MKMSFENKWTFLADATRNALKRLEKMGARQAEAYLLATRTIETSIRNSEVFTENAIEDMGLSFRVATRDNRVGFACTNIVNNEQRIMDTGEKALSIAKLSAPVPGFALPDKQRAPRVEGLFDKAVVIAGAEDAVGIARRLIESTEAVDKRVGARGGQVSLAYIRKGVVNSLGVDVETEETQAVAFVYGNGVNKSEPTPSCVNGELLRSLSLNPEKTGQTVGRMIVDLFDPKQVESFEGSVVFEPEAVSYQLCDAVLGAVKGEVVVAGGSPWAGKTEKTVAPAGFTMFDDGILKGGFASRAFDDEGYPSQRTTLISNGKLKGFLHNATTANTLKTKNTGNASRFAGGMEMTKMIIGSGYKARPEVYPSNLVIQPGNKSKEKLVSEVDRGLLVGSMAGFVQAGSGLISAQLGRAHYIEHGEIKHAVKGGMVSGVAFDWLKQISAIGNDAKQYFNSVVPSLRVEKVKVVGSH